MRMTRTPRRKTKQKRTPRTPTVILLIAPARAFDRGLLRGIARYANERGPWTFLREPPHYRQIDWKKKVSDRLRSGTIDGVIMREPEKIDEIIEMKVPAVCAPITRRTIDGLINIVIDNDTVGNLAANHLLDRKFCHYAYCGFADMYSSQARGVAFARRIERAGFTCDIYEQPKTRTIQRLWENELPLLTEWVKALPKPVGLFTCNDDRSRDVVEACHNAKLHIPGDVAILGVDNDEFICDLANPSLSSISLNAETIGYRAAQRLAKLMNGKDLRDLTIVGAPTHVNARTSTDIMLIDDPYIRKALLFIRQHCDQLIQVKDVAQVSGLSTRSLHKRFGALLGRSEQEQIHREKIDKVCRYLLEYRQTVAQIANRLGFADTKQLDRIFKRFQGMTPTQYRKKYHIG